MILLKTLTTIAAIHEAANHYIIQEMEKRGIKGLVPSHGAILNALYSKGSMTMKEIAEAIKRKQSTVTVLTEKLVQNGYVKKEKDSEDSRVWNIILTTKGLEFQLDFVEISQNLNKKIHAGMSNNEINTLTAFLEKIELNF